MKSAVKDILENVVQLELSDEALDIQKIIKQLPKEERLLVLAVALGIPMKTLRVYYSANANILYKSAEKKLQKLFDEYGNQLKNSNTQEFKC